MNGYESLVWVKDENGHEFCCEANAVRENFADGDRLNEQERASCFDVNGIIGTERW